MIPNMSNNNQTPIQNSQISQDKSKKKNLTEGLKTRKKTCPNNPDLLIPQSHSVSTGNINNKKKLSDDTNNLVMFLANINEDLIDYVTTQKGSR